MLKKKSLIVVSASLLLGIVALAACGNKTTPSSTTPSGDKETSEPAPITSSSQDNTPKTFKVTFYVDGNPYGDVQNVKQGEKATKPADPSKKADNQYTYVFDGWYPVGSKTAWDFNTAITENLDLYAKFNEVEKTHDVSVWVWGGADATTPLISKDESDRASSVVAKLDDLKDKDIGWSYYSGISNDNFNKTISEATVKPDIVISGANMTNGDYAVALDQEYGRTKVGLGWWHDAKRYIGMTASVGSHFNDAKVIYDTLKEEGPDFFSLDKTSLSMNVGEEKTVSASYSEGETRTVTWTSANPTIATVQNGVITAVANGETTVSATLGYYTVDVAITVSSVNYDLVVWVNGGSSGDKISEDESVAMKAEVVKIAGENIDWKYYAQGDESFVNAVNGAEVDVVVGSSNLDSSSKSYHVNWLEGFGKTHVGDGWFADGSRYFGLPASGDTEHNELAKKVYTLIKGVGPNHKISLDKTESTLTVGNTEQLSAEYWGTTCTWATSDSKVVTVSENGLVTAVAAGNANVTATDAAGNVATIAYTVIEGAIEYTYDLNVYVNGDNGSSVWFTEDKAAYLQSSFTAEGAPGHGKNVHIQYVGDVKVAAFAENIKSQLTVNTVDVIIARSAFFKNDAASDIATSYEAIDKTWGYDSGYVGTNLSSPSVHSELAASFVSFVKAADENYPVSLDKNEAKVEVGSTVTLTATYVGESITWTSSNSQVATVTDGVVTGVAAGETTITVTDAKGHTATCVVTVTAASAVDTESVNTLNVWLWMENNSSVYITADEATAIENAIKALPAAEGKTIKINQFAKGKSDAFNSAVAADSMKVDLAIAGGNFATDTNPCSTKVEVDSSWLASTTKRYLCVPDNSCDTPELTSAVVTLLSTAKAV